MRPAGPAPPGTSRQVGKVEANIETYWLRFDTGERRRMASRGAPSALANARVCVRVCAGSGDGGAEAFRRRVRHGDSSARTRWARSLLPAALYIVIIIIFLPSTFLAARGAGHAATRL